MIRRPNLAWVERFPLYGLGNEFAVERWLASVAEESEIQLGHGDPRSMGGPQLMVGFLVAPAIGTIDMADTLGTRLVLRASEERLAVCQAAAERQAVVAELLTRELPALEWAETMWLTIDGSRMPFVRADVGAGDWAAYHWSNDVAICVQARRWTLMEPQTLRRVVDLGPYLSTVG